MSNLRQPAPADIVPVATADPDLKIAPWPYSDVKIMLKSMKDFFDGFVVELAQYLPTHGYSEHMRVFF